jgi:leucyl aminopeptidase
MSFELNVQALPKSGAPEASEFLKVTFAYENQIDKIKKSSSFPSKAFESLKFKEEAPYACVNQSSGYGKKEVVLFFQDKISTFFLHEALRKHLTLNPSNSPQMIFDLKALKGTDEERVTLALSLLIQLTSYESPVFGQKAKKSTDTKETSKKNTCQVFLASNLKLSKLSEIFSLGQKQGEAMNLTRHLAELPGNHLGPKQYVEKIKTLVKTWTKTCEGTLEFKFLDQKALAKRGAEAFLAVVRATPEGENGIVHLSYKPKKSKGRKIALVGKGLCFDTGGYNVKTGNYMYDMHRDMTGSAVALSLFGLMAQTNAKEEVHAYLALAENLISPTGFRPNDVVVASNGVSIEVVNTDAEGRMVLSDTLVYACENRPEMIIDYATLTGAVIRSIGTARSGTFSNFESLREHSHKAGDACGERVWSFPIGSDYWKGIQSDYADVLQCRNDGTADHIYAATFLSKFVKKEIPWLHVDLASESNKGGLGISSKDITGYGVRLGYELIQTYKAPKISKKKS